MKKKCKVCGKRFMPSKEAAYQVKNELAVFAALTGDSKIYDAIDCPRCGCQVVLAVRIPNKDEPQAE